ncbi:MAG: AraC family transcriptional regulator [Bacteroidota bacterium]
MKSTNLNALPGAFTLLPDAGFPFNRIIRSKVKNFELESTTVGVSIKYVTQGTETYVVGGETMQVGAGEFLITNHLRELTIDIHESNPVEGICLYLDPHRLRSMWEEAHQSDEHLLENPGAENQTPLEFLETVFKASHSPLNSILSRIMHFHQLQRMWPEEQVQQVFFLELGAAMIEHKQQMEGQIAAIPAAKYSTKIELHRRLCMAKEYMHEYFDGPIQLADVAQAAYLSEFHFLRTFKTCFGQTPYQYLLELRIERAQELLRTTSMPVRSVAEHSGFTDPQYFNRLFKRKLGRSPRQYRLEK